MWSEVDLVSLPDRLRAWGDGDVTADPATGLPNSVPVLVDSAKPSASIIAPRKGKVRNLFVRQEAAPGGVDTVTYTLFVNAGATALTVTIQGAAVTGSDLVNVVDVAQGDLLSIRLSTNTSPNDPRVTRAEAEFI